MKHCLSKINVSAGLHLIDYSSIWIVKNAIFITNNGQKRNKSKIVAGMIAEALLYFVYATLI